MVRTNNRWRSAIATLVMAVAAPLANAADDDVEYAPYIMVEDALNTTQATIARAREEGKLVLIVLGANWCHDSKAFAKRLENSELKAVLDESYETLVIGVGYYEQGFDVAKAFGIEIYTHTPTVLIYDPKSEAVINMDDHHIWRDAARVSEEETLAYFKAKADPAGWSPIPESATYSAELNAFERQQALRLREAYAFIGPKIEARSDDLNDVWAPIRDFRYNFTNDITRLRQEHREAAASGEAFDPEWPTYEPFPWDETEAQEPSER
ncbi:MAG: thioredoxin family protein [Pseudomonadota bacterium]